MTAAAATLDPRTTLARPDMAEQALEGVVRATAYRAARPMHCAVAVADIEAGPGRGTAPLDQLIFGEAFDVLLAEGGRMWGQARRDGVVGWVDAAHLAEGAPLPNRTVTEPTAVLPLNALVAGTDRAGTSMIGDFLDDPVAVAQALLGTPHRLGGRTPTGTDCSGLVQQALYACGRAGPRYADQQAELGQPVERSAVRRGDLAIWLNAEEGPWRGHSAFVLDEDRLLHASGAHGAVVIEALADAEARYKASGFTAPVFRRL
ncbi:MAG TPA: NlpC/P60 family protein [Brevundimonas sp.]|uniref:C40 family peptidase n=1 Tax=Brevundimonas sp. TaxID=1871086 RepID=UPI002ED927E2